MSQSVSSFKPTYEDERLPYTTLNNTALLLCLLYIVAPTMHGYLTGLPLGSGQLVTVNFLQ